MANDFALFLLRPEGWAKGVVQSAAKTSLHVGLLHFAAMLGLASFIPGHLVMVALHG